MSEMTITEARAARAVAEAQIGEILLALHRATGLNVYDVRLDTTCISVLEHDRPQVISIDARIKLEVP